MKFAEVYDKFMEYVDYTEWYDYIKKEVNLTNDKIKNITEIGCGTGEFLYLYKKNGFDIIGVDISNEMLGVASKKLKNKGMEDILLLEQNMLNLNSGRQNDMIIAFFDTINYLHTTKELSVLFEKAAENLKEGGLFLFDVATKELLEEMFPGGLFYDDREDMTIIWEHNHNRKTKLDEIAVTFFVADKDGKYERVDDYYEKRIFSNDEIKKSVEKSSFNLKKIFKNNTLAGHRVFYLLEKKH